MIQPINSSGKMFYAEIKANAECRGVTLELNYKYTILENGQMLLL
jgi:hypothetical protein